jgi:hypothetical protein
MANNFALLVALAPYLANVLFSLLVAIAWIVAFTKLKHPGPAALAFASLCGALLSAISGALWYQVTQGYHQFAQYLGIIALVHIVLVDSLMIAGAFLLAFHRPKALVSSPG